MVLEAVMFCVDNSEYMRNGDHSPTRLDAQNEAVNYVARAKCEGNQETSVSGCLWARGGWGGTGWSTVGREGERSCVVEFALLSVSSSAPVPLFLSVSREGG